MTTTETPNNTDTTDEQRGTLDQTLTVITLIFYPLIPAGALALYLYGTLTTTPEVLPISGIHLFSFFLVGGYVVWNGFARRQQISRGTTIDKAYRSLILSVGLCIGTTTAIMAINTEPLSLPTSLIITGVALYEIKIELTE